MTTKRFSLNNVRHWLVTGLVAGAAAIFTGCGAGGSGGPPPDMAMPVVFQTPTLSEVQVTLAAVGTVEADEQVDIQPEVSGLIEQIQFEEGDRVEQGQPLFQLNSRAEAASLAQAEAELQLAESNLERAKTLIGTKAISQQELDQLASLVAVKASTLDGARERLDERSIEAPFRGRVGPRRVSPGQYVNAGSSLVTLVDDDNVKVNFSVPEREVARVAVDQLVKLRVAAYPDREFQGVVRLIDPVVDEATRTVGVQCVAPNVEHLLKPGMFARIEVVVDTREQALVIPEAALVPSLEAMSVYRVQDGVARLTPVTLGVRRPGAVEILSGLEPDTQIVASGLQKIVDGMKVVPASTSTNGPAETL